MAIELTTPAEPTASPPTSPVTDLSTAEVAECACPDFCERDHDRD